ISKISDIKTNLSANYLKDLYYKLNDTVQLQYTVLESLLQQQTSYAFNIFRDIVSAEPPVLDVSNKGLSSYPSFIPEFARRNYSYDNGNFLDELSDSLQLTKTILPDLLPLLNLEDYNSNIMELLGKI